MENHICVVSWTLGYLLKSRQLAVNLTSKSTLDASAHQRMTQDGRRNRSPKEEQKVLVEQLLAVTQLNHNILEHVAVHPL
jgi:hypothetical protein